MIIEAILTVIKVALEFIFSLLPTLDLLQMPIGFIEWFINVLSGVSYFLPITDFLIMFGLWMAITNFQIVWKLLQRIWDALPFT